MSSSRGALRSEGGVSIYQDPPQRVGRNEVLSPPVIAVKAVVPASGNIPSIAAGAMATAYLCSTAGSPYTTQYLRNNSTWGQLYAAESAGSEGGGSSSRPSSNMFFTFDNLSVTLVGTHCLQIIIHVFENNGECVQVGKTWTSRFEVVGN